MSNEKQESTPSAAVSALIAGIKDADETVRTKAWGGAGAVGAAGVKPLAEVMTDADREVARAAKRGLWKIVRHVGRPGADDEKKAVVAELIDLLSHDQPRAVRVEVLWMLSEIGDDQAVDPMAALLSSPELREDCRMALDRIPGDRALGALKAALATAPDDFKPNLAHSLRRRGVEVPGLPSRKLVPTKATQVKPVGR